MLIKNLKSLVSCPNGFNIHKYILTLIYAHTVITGNIKNCQLYRTKL